MKAAEKSNGIVAIPKLLDMLAIEGAIVTTDAMGWQCEIAQKIVDKKADYVLALKGNQDSLREDVEVFIAERKAKDFRPPWVYKRSATPGQGVAMEQHYTHPDLEDRCSIAWLQERHNWPSLKAVVLVTSTRETGEKIEREMRFYITSLVPLAILLGPIGRGHGAIENSLHWVMDRFFRDNEPRIRTGHPPADFITVKHIAHNLIQKAPGKDPLRLKRKFAAWNDDFFVSVVGA